MFFDSDYMRDVPTTILAEELAQVDREFARIETIFGRRMAIGWELMLEFELKERAEAEAEAAADAEAQAVIHAWIAAQAAQEEAAEQQLAAAEQLLTQLEQETATIEAHNHRLRAELAAAQAEIAAFARQTRPEVSHV